jgi:hypothetical protein
MTTSLDNILSGASAAAPVSEAPAEKPAQAELAPAPVVVEAKPAAEKPASQAPAAAQPAPQPEAEEKDVDGKKFVPKAALDEARGKVKRYTEQVADFERKLGDQNAAWERRFEQLVGAIRTGQQPQPQNVKPESPAPDFFANPEEAVQAMIQKALAPVAAGQGRMTEAVSRLNAIGEHGQEAVQAAYTELANRANANPAAMQGEYQRIMSSPNPWGELVKWHKNESLLKEVGGDLSAFEAKMREKIMAELAEKAGSPAPAAPAVAQAPKPAAPAAAPAPAMPSNLAGARNAGSRSGPAWGGPTSLKDIFDRGKTRAA